MGAIRSLEAKGMTDWGPLACLVLALGLLATSVTLGRKKKWKRLEWLTLASALALIVVGYAIGDFFITEGLPAWAFTQRWVLLAAVGFGLLDDLTTFIALRQTPGEGEGNPWMAEAFKEHGQLKSSIVRWVGILLILTFLVLVRGDKGLLVAAAMFGLVVLNNVSAILQFVFRPEFARKVRALQLDRTLYIIRAAPLVITAFAIAYLI